MATNEECDVMRKLTAIKIFSLGIGMLFCMTGCTQTVEWKEEVRLLDGRVIAVTQKKLCKGGDYRSMTDASCLASDVWVTLNLPEISNKQIVWHESLDAMVINVYRNKLYIVGTPQTSFAFRRYGAINPPYFGFVWESGSWRRMPFAEIPSAIYEGNMLVSTVPKRRTSYVTLKEKQIDRTDGIQPPHSIDPNYTISAH